MSAARDETLLEIDVENAGSVSAIRMLPERPRCLYVLAHGAGAGMRHRLLDAVAHRLFHCGIGTMRFRFPYREAGRKRPDPQPLLEATVEAAIRRARTEAPGVPLIAGGKSLGGRMTSNLAARSPFIGVKGIVFLGFPLHPVKKPGAERAGHLSHVSIPMLFVQGTRDPLADLERLRPVLDELGPRATLHVIEGGDHSFDVLKRSGRTPDEVLDEIAGAVDTWVTGVLEADDLTPQAGVVPYRRTADGVEYCLITTMGGNWGLPKGMIDPGETGEETATKEALEEAGLVGDLVGPQLGSFEYRKWGLTLHATFYLMRVDVAEEVWEEKGMRDRCWVGYEEARKLLSRNKLRNLLDEAHERLEET